MEETILEEIENYIKRYHNTIFINNSYEEFYTFFIKYSFERINPLKEINKIITDRLIDSEELMQTYGFRVNYNNNLDGVNALKKISNLVSNIKLMNENYIKGYYYYFLLKIALKSTYPEIHIKTLEQYKNLVEFYSKQINTLFRGQSNKDWNIVPSCLRNINTSATKIYKYEDLIKQYTDIKVYDMYNEIIDNIGNAYELVSFLQHSISFSPLVDFTSKFVVASVFALSNYSVVNDFFNKDSAIYILKYDEKDIKEIDGNLESMKIGIYKSEKLTAKDYDYMYKNMKKMIGDKANIYISRQKTNDRMRYQSGAFVLFDNFIIEDINNIVVKISEDFVLTKLIIDKSIKLDIMRYLKEKHPNYMLNYLMNPYERFERIF